jgi:tRNA(Ile)-lysidine synthase
MKDLTSRVFRFVRRHQLFSPGAAVLAAVSGGGDSTALICLLMDASLSWKLKVRAAHVNHALRPESEDDEAYVRGLCARLGVPLFVERAQGLDPVGPDLENRARAARYAALSRAAKAAGASIVLTGHTADDRAETVLMRLLRGSGPDSLGGMRPIRPLSDGVSLGRPLLSESREVLRAYLRSRSVSWREDASNFGRQALRNRVRASILPALAEENPRVVSALGNLAEILRAESEVWRPIVTAAMASATEGDEVALRIDCAAFASLPLAVQRRVVQEGYATVAAVPGMNDRLSFVQVEEVRCLATAMQAGQEITLPRGVRARRVGGRVEMGHFADLPDLPERSPIDGDELHVPGRVIAVDLGLLVEARLQEPGAANAEQTAPWQISLPAGLGSADLRVRGARAGDKIALKGMTGRRHVMDLLSDAAVPRWDRDRAPVVTADGEVVWVVGLRASAAADVPNGGARRLVLRAWPLEARGTDTATDEAGATGT